LVARARASGAADDVLVLIVREYAGWRLLVARAPPDRASAAIQANTRFLGTSCSEASFTSGGAGLLLIIVIVVLAAGQHLGRPHAIAWPPTSPEYPRRSPQASPLAPPRIGPCRTSTFDQPYGRPGFHSNTRYPIPRFETSLGFCGSGRSYLPTARSRFAAGGPAWERRNNPHHRQGRTEAGTQAQSIGDLG
jgi:hypothetical protein